jgi:hypothetical protein
MLRYQRSEIRFYNVSNQTSGANKHLKEKHNLTKHGTKVTPAKRKNPFDAAQKVEQARLQTINLDEYYARVLKWIVMDKLSLRQASFVHFQEFPECCHHSAGELHYTSHNSVRRLIKISIEQARHQITQKLRMACSLILFSFDAWSSRSHLPFLGIYARFIDEDYKLCTRLFALKHLKGMHTGNRLGDVLFKVLITYNLTDKIGWFVADNATSNDTTLRKLSHLTPLDLPEQRLRCLGHVLNLTCQAMLHGTDVESFDHIDINNIDVDRRSSLNFGAISRAILRKSLMYWHGGKLIKLLVQCYFKWLSMYL